MCSIEKRIYFLICRNGSKLNSNLSSYIRESECTSIKWKASNFKISPYSEAQLHFKLIKIVFWSNLYAFENHSQKQIPIVSRTELYPKAYDYNLYTKTCQRNVQLPCFFWTILFQISFDTGPHPQPLSGRFSSTPQ